MLHGQGSCLIKVKLPFLFALAIRCDALLWDFEEKAQENDWKVISGTGETEKDTYKISHGAEGLAIVSLENCQINSFNLKPVNQYGWVPYFPRQRQPI